MRTLKSKKAIGIKALAQTQGPDESELQDITQDLHLGEFSKCLQI